MGFLSPNVEKLVQKKDHKGLAAAFQHYSEKSMRDQAEAALDGLRDLALANDTASQTVIFRLKELAAAAGPDMRPAVIARLGEVACSETAIRSSRHTAIDLLGSIKDPDAADALISVLQVQDSSVADAAMRALKMDWTTGDGPVHARARQAVREYQNRPSQAEARLRRAQLESQTDESKRQAELLDALTQAQARLQARPAPAEQARYVTDPETARRIAGYLAELDTPKWNLNQMRFKEAIRALGELGEGRHAQKLLAVLERFAGPDDTYTRADIAYGVAAALSRLLERAACDVPGTTLQAIARHADVGGLRRTMGAGMEMEDAAVSVDFSRARDLAQQELDRREAGTA